MHVYSKVLNMHAFKISSLSLTISPIQYAYGSIAHTLHGLQICTVPRHQVGVLLMSMQHAGAHNMALRSLQNPRLLLIQQPGNSLNN